MKLHFRTFLVCLLLLFSSRATLAEKLEPIGGVPRQAFTAATERLIDALKFSGSLLDDKVRRQLEAAFASTDDREAVRDIQRALDPLCLAEVNINAESRVKVKEGPVSKSLMQQGWRTFLVKVHNQAGVNPELKVESPNAAPVYQRGKGSRQQPRTDEKLVNPSDVPNRWLDVALINREPLKTRLSGLVVEYRLIALYSRDVGKREASFAFNIGQGTQDLGFRNAVPILFDCESAVEVTLNIKDTDGEGTTAAFVVRDRQGRVYPNPAR